MRDGLRLPLIGHVGRRHLIASAVVAASVAGHGASASSLPALPSLMAPAPTSVLQEFRYRMSAAIRPLLFWIGDNDVGGARITWRGSDDGRGFELLLGADPLRAPRKINRWGWVREDEDASGATMIGLIRKTDEKTLEESRKNLDPEGRTGYVFKAIQARVEGSSAVARNSVWQVAKDYTYRDIAELREMVSAPSPARFNEATLPPGTRPSFMIAVADVVAEAINAATGAGGLAPRLLADRSWAFVFDANLYDLRLGSTRWEKSATYGGRRFERLLRLDFESFNRKLETIERFTLVCGTEAPWKGVPVYVKYQPKWWFKAEGVLDDTQTFQ